MKKTIVEKTALLSLIVFLLDQAPATDNRVGESLLNQNEVSLASELGNFCRDRFGSSEIAFARAKTPCVAQQSGGLQ
jgi:hypothetical protein